MTAWRDWRWLAALAAMVASTGMLFLGFGQFLGNRQQSEDAAAADCRGQLGAAQSDAQTDYLLAFGEVVVALASDDRDRVLDAIDALGSAGTGLSDARDARIAFEDDPSEGCP